MAMVHSEYRSLRVELEVHPWKIYKKTQHVLLQCMDIGLVVTLAHLEASWSNLEPARKNRNEEDRYRQVAA